MFGAAKRRMTPKNKQSIKKIAANFIRRFHSCFQKHWIIFTIFLTGASWWFSLIITFFGEQFYLIGINEAGNKFMTWQGIVTTAILFLLLFLTSASQIYCEKHNDDKIKLEQINASYVLIEKVLTSVGDVCDNKFNNQIKLIKDIKDGKTAPPQVYSEPCKQLQKILDEISACLATCLQETELRVKKRDIYVSLAYNFPLENEETWQWALAKQEKGLTIKQLLTPKTTFYYLLNNEVEQPLVFFNSKEEAYIQGHYLPDEQDERDRERKLKGSIACYLITIKLDNTTYIRAILSFSTHNKMFVKDNEDKDVLDTVIHNIKETILTDFSKRINIELCNYYLQYLYGNHPT